MPWFQRFLASLLIHAPYTLRAWLMIQIVKIVSINISSKPYKIQTRAHLWMSLPNGYQISLWAPCPSWNGASYSESCFYGCRHYIMLQLIHEFICP